MTWDDDWGIPMTWETSESIRCETSQTDNDEPCFPFMVKCLQDGPQTCSILKTTMDTMESMELPSSCGNQWEDHLELISMGICIVKEENTSKNRKVFKRIMVRNAGPSDIHAHILIIFPCELISFAFIGINRHGNP